MITQWSNPIYRQTVAIVLGTLFLVGSSLFFLRKKNMHMTAAWASVNSWLFAAPIIFVILALPEPWPLLALTFTSILGAKSFFQITGMYHRSNFVWICYLGIFSLMWSIHNDMLEFYQVLPMIVMGAACMVPILRNSSKHMLQYISLTLVNFSLFWSFMHLGWILKWDNGLYLVIYIGILAEVCDNIYIAASRFFRRIELFHKITANRSLEGFIIAIMTTLLLAWGLRHLLPDRSEKFWVATGLIVALAGSLGDLTLMLLRRDLGIKDVNTFIIGRGDLLSRLDRFIFVSPLIYYAIRYLKS